MARSFQEHVFLLMAELNNRTECSMPAGARRLAQPGHCVAVTASVGGLAKAEQETTQSIAGEKQLEATYCKDWLFSPVHSSTSI